MRTHFFRMPTGSGLAAALVLFLVSMSSIAAYRIFGYDNSSEGANALVLPSCGPTDGPATEIYLSDDMLKCSRVPVVRFEGAQQETFVQIFLAGPRPAAGATVVLQERPEDPNRQGGFARRCVRGGDCEMTYQGMATFGKPTEEGRIPLHIQLQFEGGKQVNGNYEALTCERELLCG